jgi:hypothetical protein
MGKNQDPGFRIQDKHPGSATPGEIIINWDILSKFAGLTVCVLLIK